MAEQQPTDLKAQVETAKRELTQLRDEIRVKINLGAHELRDEWSKLEDKILQLEDTTKRALQPAAEEVSSTWSKVKSEVLAFRDRIKKD
jgi:predicted  nucleic acid-binding Zn-ribbon protein